VRLPLRERWISHHLFQTSLNLAAVQRPDLRSNARRLILRKCKRKSGDAPTRFIWPQALHPPRRMNLRVDSGRPQRNARNGSLDVLAAPKIKTPKASLISARGQRPGNPIIEAKCRPMACIISEVWASFQPDTASVKAELKAQLSTMNTFIHQQAFRCFFLIPFDSFSVRIGTNRFLSGTKRSRAASPRIRLCHISFFSKISVDLPH
jgi:hypothetical protein